MAPDIVVIDYHKGNIASVVRGLTAAGGRARISDDPAEIERADALVLPGVGSFGDAMAYLNESGQATVIKRAIEAGTPFLGICLGLQLLFDWGTEGHEDELDENGRVAGLGVLRGHCDVLPQVGLKIPHVGWDQVHLTDAGRENPLTRGVTEGSNFYFTHSYVVYDAREEDVLGTTDYACVFPSVVGRENVFAAQFHPEKSSEKGGRLMDAFVRIVEERA